MPGKKQVVVLLVLPLLLLTVLAVPELASGLYAGPDDVLIFFKPETPSISPGCPKAVAVLVFPTEDFNGKVNFTAVNLSQGVTAVFDPSTVQVPKWGNTSTTLLVNVPPQTPQGHFNLTFLVSGFSVSPNGGPIKKLVNLTLNIGSQYEQIPTSQIKTTTTVTTTSIETITRTSTVTLASITEAVDEPPPLLSLSGNSSAVVWSRRLFNNSLLVTTSIDKLLYSPDETMHLKGTLTNLTPQPITVQLAQNHLWVSNNNNTFWVTPEITFLYIGMTMPPSPRQFPTTVEMAPRQTITLSEVTRDWNMTGLRVYDAVTPSRVVYDNHTVPEGQYLVLFDIGVSRGEKVQYIEDEIPFGISRTATQPTAPTSTITQRLGEQTPDTTTYAWAVSATVAALVLAAVLVLQRRRSATASPITS